MSHDLQSGAAQHGFHSAAIGYPPVRRIVGVGMLDEVHAGKIRIAKWVHVPELIIIFPLLLFRGAAHHALENEFAADLLDYLIQGKEWIAQMVEHTHEQHIV